jgi:hypothetical protein
VLLSATIQTTLKEQAGHDQAEVGTDETPVELDEAGAEVLL